MQAAMTPTLTAGGGGLEAFRHIFPVVNRRKPLMTAIRRVAFEPDGHQQITDQAEQTAQRQAIPGKPDQEVSEKMKTVRIGGLH